MLAQKNYLKLALVAIVALSTAFTLLKDKPTLYVIGDSTVKNGSGKGASSLWGWGEFIGPYFDKEKINIENHAMGGTSSRTFISKGLWDSVMVKIKPGDFVIMQFGHNDGSPLDDTARARGTIRGVGTESKEIYNPITKKKEIVYTYGWYLRKLIKEARSKGATAIVCSPVPRSDWKEGKVIRSENGYAGWAEEVAKSENAYFVNLNKIIADKYDISGEQVVKNYFPSDHTHTNEAGAKINAASVAEGLQLIRKCPLNRYMIKK